MSFGRFIHDWFQSNRRLFRFPLWSIFIHSQIGCIHSFYEDSRRFGRRKRRNRWMLQSMIYVVSYQVYLKHKSFSLRSRKYLYSIDNNESYSPLVDTVERQAKQLRRWLQNQQRWRRWFRLSRKGWRTAKWLVRFLSNPFCHTWSASILIVVAIVGAEVVSGGGEGVREYETKGAVTRGRGTSVVVVWGEVGGRVGGGGVGRGGSTTGSIGGCGGGGSYFSCSFDSFNLFCQRPISLLTWTVLAIYEWLFMNER